MAKLAIAINEATEVERQKSEEHLDSIEYGQAVADAIGKKEAHYEVGNLDGLSTDNQRRYIYSLVQSYIANGKDIGDLNVDGLSNETTLESLLDASDETIKKMFGDVRILLDTDVEGERKKLSKTEESSMFNYQIGHNVGVLQNLGTENTDELMSRTGVILA
jgi:hypothetical protein